jgi:hypothetical protein
MTTEILWELGAADIPVRLEDPLAESATWGIVVSPALMLGEQLLVNGRLPSQRHLRKLIREALRSAPLC